VDQEEVLAAEMVEMQTVELLQELEYLDKVLEEDILDVFHKVQHADVAEVVAEVEQEPLVVMVQQVKLLLEL
jgi:hypothetical protein